MHPLSAILAQYDPSRKSASQTFSEMLPWLGLLFLAILVGGVFILWLRNRLRADDTQSDDLGFTLADLKKLRDRGELSPEEYEVARNRMTKKLKENLNPNPLGKKPRTAAGDASQDSAADPL